MEISNDSKQVIKLSKAHRVMIVLVNFFTPLVIAIGITGHYMRENNLHPIFCAFVLAFLFSSIFVITSLRKIGKTITKEKDNITISDSNTTNLIKSEDIKNIEARNFSTTVIISLNNGSTIWSLNYGINAVVLLAIFFLISPIVAIPFVIQGCLYTTAINNFLKGTTILNLNTDLLKVTNIFCWISCIYITFWGIYCLIVNHIIVSDGWLFK